MYEKQTWVSGEIVTEGKLNHMEEGIATGGGIYSSEYATYFDGEVTTESGTGGAIFGFIDFNKIPPEKEILVTFNGNEYTLPYVVDSEGNYWGEVDDNSQPAFSNYPIFITYPDGQACVFTAETGTYSLTIKSKELQINSEFRKSLNSVIVPSNFRGDVYAGGVSGDKTYNFIEIDEDLSSVAEKNFIHSPDIQADSIILVKFEEITLYPAESVPSGSMYLDNECQCIPIAYIVDAGQENNSLAIFQAVIVKEGTATFKNKID